MKFNQMSHSDLIQACVSSDPDAWTEFFARYNQIISLTALRTVRRYSSDTAIVKDLIQETYLKLCDDGFRILKNFELRTENSIYGFLKVVTTNVVHDYFRSKKRPQNEIPLDEIYDLSHPEMWGSQKSMEREISIREVEEVLAELDGPDAERDRKIFWLHHSQAFTAHDIATLFE